MKGTILCNKDGAKMSSKTRTCPKCGRSSCYILIYWFGKPWKYYDEDGVIFQYTTALKQLLAMNREMEQENFNTEAWQPRSIQKRKIKNAVEEFLKTIKSCVLKKQLSPNTYATYQERVYNHLLHAEYGLGERDIQDIDTTHIRTFREGLPEGLAINTHNSIMTVVHTFFMWAEEVGLIENVPVFPRTRKGTARGRKTRKRIALTIPQQQEALRKIPEQHRDIFEFETEVGSRPGETCALKVMDCNAEKHELTIQRTFVRNVLIEYGNIKESDKEGHSDSDDEEEQQIATVPLSPRAFQIYQKHAAGKLPGAWLFMNPVGKTNVHYTVNYLSQKVWGKYTETGVTHYEGTRHSFCTQVVQANKDITVAQRLLRHASPESTRRYVHHDREYLRDALQNRTNVVDLHKQRKEQQG